MITTNTILQGLINGILMGAIYGVVSIGLTLIFGVMRIINFAHGEMVMLGMYVTYWLFTLFGVDPYVSLILSFPILFVLGALLQRYVVSLVLERSHSHKILMSFGVKLILANMALLMWRADYRAVRVDYGILSYKIRGIFISFPRSVAFITGLILTTVLFVFLNKTRIGKAIRATAQDKQAAQLMGINVGRINTFTFGLASALAGAAGSLISPFLYVYPAVGGHFGLISLVVIVLGGMGNFQGAFLGSMIIGVLESMTSVFLTTRYKNVTSLFVFILVLLIKPQGLFGKQE